MSKGDKVYVTFAAGENVRQEVAEAMRNGSKVAVEEPRANEAYLTVVEQDKNGNAVRTFRFAKGCVLSVIEVPKR